jgi:type IV pilus assembly protein PilY1
MQTVQTYWLDVLEYQVYKANNQYYLATKYGGFTVPTGFAPYTRTTDIPQAWWSTNGQTVGSGTSAQIKPDNYYTSAKADQMVAGLTSAFASIANQLTAYTTSFSTFLPQVSSSGVASYASKYDTNNWTGEVVASTSSFNATTGDPTQVANWSFTNTLAAQIAGTGWNASRRVVTWNNTTPGAVPFRAASLPTGQLNALDTAYRSGADSSDYLNYLRGDRSQETNSTVTGSSLAYRARTKMVGDIVRSKARVIGPPAAAYATAANPGYSTFKTTYANRTSMVYVGSNDGMLHAIDGSLTGTTAGQEVFAYIPGMLYDGPTSTPQVNGLASLGNPTFVHHAMVDGNATVVDVDFGRTRGGSGTADWRSLLVGAMGKGGKGYYAIDVTDPSAMTSETAVAGKVLWEFTETTLGYTFGDPVAVKTRKYGWVLVFGSGYNNSDGQGYFYFVNPRTGEMLEKVSTGVGSTSVDSGLAHVQPFVLDRTDNTAESVYAGDLLGNLWRLDVTGTTGTYPAPVRLAVLTDGNGTALPVTSRPLPIVQPVTNVRWITVGTGQLLASGDIANAQNQAFFAIMDGTGAAFGTEAGLPTGMSYPLVNSNLHRLTDLTAPVTINSRTEIGWWFDLGTSSGRGWRVITDPTSFFGSVSFASLLPTGDACNPSGSSRVYVIDLGTGQSELLSGTTVLSYSTAVSGSVTDLRFYSVNDTSGNATRRLIVCSDTGVCRSPDLAPNAAQSLRRLNWRELPLAD